MINREAIFSSTTDLWETPQDFFDAIDGEFHFTLDACAVPENAKCTRYYTPEQDGLSLPWEGTVWCNPPYGREIEKWVEKAANSAATVVMLLPARTDTKWFHRYIYGKAEIRFIPGRLKFGGEKNNAPFPSMVCVFRQERENPEPLTLEELKKVTWDNPMLVYTVCRDDNGNPDFDTGEYQMFDGGCFVSESCYDTLQNYGRTFIAYRHKPEEG